MTCTRSVWMRRFGQLRALALLTLAANGCGREHDAVSGAGDVEVDLAALMADGALPQGTTISPAQPTAPQRACNVSARVPAADGGVTSPPVIPLPAAGSGSTQAAPGCESVPIGFWRFDDCTAARADLTDSSAQHHTAFRSLSTTCTPGREGNAVSFQEPDDLVSVPDQPEFALDQGMTIAAWIKPDAIDGVHTLFRKRDDGDSAFALVINDGDYRIVVRLQSGLLATVSAPAKADTWTHVAATYDGTWLRLYIDGSEASHTRAPGVLAGSAGPLLMGNDGDGRRFQGAIDSAWFNVLAAPADTIVHLTCVHSAPEISVSPLMSDAVAAGTEVTYTLNVHNTQGAECEPAEVFASVSLPSADFNVDQPIRPVVTLAPGTSFDIPFIVSSGTEAEPGTYTVRFFVSQQGVSPSTPGSATPPITVTPLTVPPPPVAPGRVSTSAQYVVAEPVGCHVDSGRELIIRDLSVVEDPVRTDGASGAWSFGHLMQRLASDAVSAADMTESMLTTFVSPQTVNSFSIPARSAMQDRVLKSWPRSEDGKLDLTRAPLRLLAIVHRLDLIDAAKDKAGEGRFVFGVLDASGNPLQFTVIFEYELRAESPREVRGWQDAVHALQGLPFPSEAYNQALQALTDRFATRETLLDVRTNEIALASPWQLREFQLSPENGQLEPATLARTPDRSFANTATLGRFINQNEDAILAETHMTPAQYEGAPFAAASVFNNIDTWDAPGIDNPEARHKFALNTCNGCHGGETHTSFLHVSPRAKGTVSTLSHYLTGETVTDVKGVKRRLAELLRRRQLLESTVCAEP